MKLRYILIVVLAILFVGFTTYFLIQEFSFRRQEAQYHDARMLGGIIGGWSYKGRSASGVSKRGIAAAFVAALIGLGAGFFLMLFHVIGCS